MGEFQNIVLWLAGGAILCTVFALLAVVASALCPLTTPPTPQKFPEEPCGQCGYIRPGEWQCNCNSSPWEDCSNFRPQEQIEDKKVAPRDPDKPVGRRAAIEATKRKHEARDAA